MTKISKAEAEYPSFPMARSCPYGPPKEYEEIREQAPISKVRLAMNGREAWLVTRYDDVREILSDSRVSADITNDGYPLMLPVPMEILKSVPRALFHLDHPEHTVQRRLIMPEFTVRRIDAMRERTLEIIDEYIDAILAKGGTVDLIEELAMPIPAQAICELLGIPVEDRHFFHEYVAGILGKDSDPEQIAVREAEMAAYIERMLVERSENPGDDLVSNLIVRNEEDGFGLELAEIGILVRAIVAGGHETTANMIGLGILALIEHPDQRELLMKDRSLASRAVDELMRIFSISDFGTSRVAMEDIQLGDTLIRKGEGIIASLAAANHDPDLFPDPYRFDITRESVRNVGFGHGVHQCSGQTMVRMQLELIFPRLFERIPGLRLAVPAEELPLKNDSLIHGLYKLPVTW
ncbi:cytochrome P450 [Streptomyces violaceusniger]|uniref:Cytochrome P450 n=1 Tax=Streptomyces violaceusniger TaxID=68280 RepID=A0A4D4KLD3_STRVO|nr:cytochrome P450 [Streptomyces violaceusniger]